jgi:23S rRNA (adenine2503-C2)-methyltransferase
VPLLLKNLTTAQLEAALTPEGVPPRAVRQLQKWALQHNAWPPVGPNLPGRALTRAQALAAIPALTLLERRVSPADGFVKYLFRGDGPERFEAVEIPLVHRADDRKGIVCVSSQAGCRLGCAFCATGRLGFRRHLAAWEIVDQVVRVRAESPLPVRGVVFMGMGEPLLNYEAVMTAAEILTEPCGLAIDAKAITISTAGVAPAIRRFTAERRPYRLVVSLTAADPALRRALMPAEAQWPTPDVIAALREYHAATRRRVTLAWPLLAGVNTREADAQALAALVGNLPVKLDLMDVNDPTGRFRPPSDAELAAFRDALRRHLGAPVARRYSGGRDIHAACGMLAGGP